MKLKLFIFILGLLAFATSNAQEVEAPNYRTIRISIMNSKSDSYYPTLMRRYLRQDTTLTVEQYRNLYYGFTLQDDFVPYQSERTTLYQARESVMRNPNDTKVLHDAITVAKNAFADNPFDLLAIQTLAFCYSCLKDENNYQLWNTQKNGLLDAIVSSGDGETEESAIHVINIEHEYEVLSRMGLTIAADSLCNDKVEYLRVLDNAEEIPGVFFDFSACRKAYLKRYEE